MTALLMFGGFALLLILGVPIALSLGVSTMAAIAGSPDITVSINTVAQRLLRRSGLHLHHGHRVLRPLGQPDDQRRYLPPHLASSQRSIIGGVRGGMALTPALACAFFAALSGSAPASSRRPSARCSTATWSAWAIPATARPAFWSFPAASAPSSRRALSWSFTATITGASVGDMFKSGMGIGIGIMIVLMIVVIVLAHKEQWPKDEIHFNLKEFCISFLKAIPALMLPIIILGGIYSGLLHCNGVLRHRGGLVFHCRYVHLPRAEVV